MKKMNNILLLALLGVAGFAAFKGYQTKNILENLQVNLSSIRINAQDILKKSIVVELGYDVTNPSHYDFKFTGFTGTIIYGGRNMGNINSVDQKDIPARTSQTIRIKATLDSSSVVTELINILFVDGQVMPLRILGTMVFNDLKLPVDHTQTLTA